MRNALGCGVAVGILLAASTAMAQEPTPQPTEPVVTPKPQPTPPTNNPPANGTGTGTGTAKAAAADDGSTDHEKVVGKLGVGYFGVTAQPHGTGAAGGVGRGTVQVPVIGARYWLKERIGVDVGVGFNFFSSGTSRENGGTTVETDGPAVVAFALHAGLPLVLGYGKHYKFLAIPEINFGYSTQTVAPQNPPPGTAQPDVHFSGLRFDVGARVGTEIQFGFIGIPELALQASVGLNFRRRSWSASQDAAGTTPAASSSDGATDFGTTVQSDPWALFTNSIAAIYYLP